MTVDLDALEGLYQSAQKAQERYLAMVPGSSDAARDAAQARREFREQAPDYVPALIAEIRELRHDLDRHLKICSELATENAALQEIANNAENLIYLLQRVKNTFEAESLLEESLEKWHAIAEKTPKSRQDAL